MPSSPAVTAKHRRTRDHAQVTLPDVASALAHAQTFLWSQQRGDGLWCGDVEAAPALTAMYVIFLDLLAQPPEGALAGRLQAYLLRRQRRDGAWSSGRGLAADLSDTALAVLALRLLHNDWDTPALRAASGFVLGHGGLAQLDAPTRRVFALFGLVPWDTTDHLPLERFLLQGALLPPGLRGIAVPWSILGAHQPLFALPNGRRRRNGWLDALWLPQHERRVGSASSSLSSSSSSSLLSGPAAWLRAVALRRTSAWVVGQQAAGGLWPGGALPTMVSLLALVVQGHGLQSEVVDAGLRGLRQLIWEEAGTAHLQPLRAPVRDTALGVLALDAGPQLVAASGAPASMAGDARLAHALAALFDQQLPDVRVAALMRRPLVDAELASSAWRVRWLGRLQLAWHPLLQRRLRRLRGRVSWRSAAGWTASADRRVPQVETTGDVLLAALHHDPRGSASLPVRRGVWWLLAAQGRDGGWHDVSDAWARVRALGASRALCKPQVTARALEALALWKRSAPLAASHADPSLAHLRRRVRAACRRAVRCLRRQQDAHGSWSVGTMQHFAPTGQALCGLRQARVARGDTMVEAALRWLRDNQNVDGGWGESLPHKASRRLPGEQKSAPAATAWALMGLLAYLPPHDPVIVRGVRYMMQRQVRPARGRPRDGDGTLPLACGKTWRDDASAVLAVGSDGGGDGSDAARGRGDGLAVATCPRALHHAWSTQALARYVAACHADV